MIMNNAERAGFKVVDENGKFIPGDGGADGFLLWVALNDHKTYCALMARILPYYIVNELPDKSIISRDEAIAQLRERGLPVELIDHLRRAPEVLDSDEDPDTTASPGRIGGFRYVTPFPGGCGPRVLLGLSDLWRQRLTRSSRTVHQDAGAWAC
jgi:hypothetical protein